MNTFSIYTNGFNFDHNRHNSQTKFKIETICINRKSIHWLQYKLKVISHRTVNELIST
jgi:hypothetical protein